jgi:hypothetical protein
MSSIDEIVHQESVAMGFRVSSLEKDPLSQRTHATIVGASIEGKIGILSDRIQARFQQSGIPIDAVILHSGQSVPRRG